VSEAKLQTPGAKNAPWERDGLFDMVKWNDGERFGDEPQLATRSPVLMLRDASQRSRVCGCMRARLGCDAPQHEGEQRHVGQTKPRGRTNLRLWETIAGSVSLFPA
jgi:hypothetical protein